MDKTKENRIVGEVDAREGEILYTSIPYEPGWTIKVDGKKVTEQFVEDKDATGNSLMVNNTDGKEGSVCILNAMIGLRLAPGHHKIEMTYSPPGFKTGVLLLILGIGAIVLLYLYDRKNNLALIANAEARANWKKGIYTVVEPESENEEKKPVKIIKSKGAVDNKKAVSEKSEASDEEAKDEEKTEEKPAKNSSKGLAEELYGEETESNGKKKNNNKNNQKKKKK